jgi:hypothetical protein
MTFLFWAFRPSRVWLMAVEQACGAAEAFPLAFLFRRAGGIGLVDGFDARMEVVDVQDIELEIGERRAA